MCTRMTVNVKNRFLISGQFSRFSFRETSVIPYITMVYVQVWLPYLKLMSIISIKSSIFYSNEQPNFITDLEIRNTEF